MLVLMTSILKVRNVINTVINSRIQCKKNVYLTVQTQVTDPVLTCRNTVTKCTQHVMPSNVAICCVGML